MFDEDQTIRRFAGKTLLNQLPLALIGGTVIKASPFQNLKEVVGGFHFHGLIEQSICQGYCFLGRYNAQPSVARAASTTFSDRVGCTRKLVASSETVYSNCMAVTASPISSVALGPTI